MPVALILLMCAPPADADRQTLRAAGVNANDPAAVAGYLRGRTLRPADRQKLEAEIAKLGAEKFEDRQAASRAVLPFGPAAVPLLRDAVRGHTDPEVQHRASEALRELGKVPHPLVAAAAVRALAANPPADAAAVLLEFLPAADDRPVAAAVRNALRAVAYRDGAAVTAVVAALADAEPSRRSAAAVALAADPVRSAEVAPKVLAAAVAEADPDGRFQMLFALAAAARHKPAVAPLIELMPTAPRGRQWQIEDLLTQIAGSDPRPPAAWRGWWKAAADGLDLRDARYVPRTTGGLLLVSVAPAAEGLIAAEVGPDGGERWRLKLPQTADLRPLPDGKLQVGERLGGNAGYRVSVVDPLTGTAERSRTFPMTAPNLLEVPYREAHPLAGGGVLLVGPGEVAEHPAADGPPVFVFKRHQKMDIAAACRLTDGRTLVLVKGGPPAALLLDAAGKELPGPPPAFAEQGYVPAPVVVGPGRVLVVEPGRLAEYDLAANKLVWQRPTVERGSVRSINGVQRLANGNTLFVEGTANGGSRVVEVGADGEEVWAYAPPGGQPGLFRAFQR